MPVPNAVLDGLVSGDKKTQESMRGYVSSRLSGSVMRSLQQRQQQHHHSRGSRIRYSETRHQPRCQPRSVRFGSCVSTAAKHQVR